MNFRQMRITPIHLASVPAIILAAGVPGFAAVYLSLEEAQQLMFPDEGFTPIPLVLSPEQRAAIEEKGGVPLSSRMPRIWQTSRGGYFIADEVIGKHEYIPYAVGINPDGSVRQIEILEYREAYGFEIRQKKWRRQFTGKTGRSALKLNSDIKNISGATLSCRHVTEGIKRVLALYELVFKK